MFQEIEASVMPGHAEEYPENWENRKQRVRIRFRKHGDLRWIGHRDLVRTIERVFRRANVQVALSEGYHPKPRFSFPSALALGIEGHEEVFEAILVDPPSPAELLRRLNQSTVAGLDFLGATILPKRLPKARVVRCSYCIAIPRQNREAVATRIQQLHELSSCQITRPGSGAMYDLKQFLEKLELDQEMLHFVLRAELEGAPGPRDVLGALGIEHLETEGCVLVRTAVELAESTGV